MNDDAMQVLKDQHDRAREWEARTRLGVAMAIISGVGVECPTCQGWGLRTARWWLLERWAQPCDDCNGHGWKKEDHR